MPRTFELSREITLPRSRDQVFPFFADPANLETITPGWLRFRVLESTTPDVHEGTRIRYRLRLHGIPIRWTSKISRWEPPFRFVDEQESGPYRRWVHLHTFEEVDSPDGPATFMRDQVRYQVWGGTLVNFLVVARDLERIFDYRQRSMAELFGAEHFGG